MAGLDKMKYRVLIGFLFAALLLGGCRRERAVSADESPKLSITLEIPAAPGTKADEGEAASQMEEENAIYDLKIWVFKHDNHEKVLFAKYPNDEHPNPDDLPQAGTVKKYVFSVDRSLATDNPRPTLDVFVLANSGSINCTLGDVDYTTLTEATFGGSSFFGPESPVTPAILESRKSDSEENRKGLPMSGVGEELKISGEDYSLSIGKITMQRAVSKLRYVFCQTLNIGEDAESIEVLRVELDNNLIPNQEYVFSPDGGQHVMQSGGYVNTIINTPNTDPVPSSAIPELYTYTGSGASGAADYERLVLGAIDEHKLLCPATYYLRESDKPLSGKVYYQVLKKTGDDDYVVVPPAERVKTFKMETPDFTRNHTWTMYGYFISDRTLILSLNVLPWDMNIYNIDFLTSSASVTVPLTVDPFSVRSIERVGETDDYKVYMKEGAPAKAYLNIVTPNNGTIEVIVKGVDGSEQCFEVTQSSTEINSKINHGRIDISVDAKQPFQESYHGKSISLDFKVYTPDNSQEVALGSEAINQNYIFILP
jgi:hypothetical protein